MNAYVRALWATALICPTSPIASPIASYAHITDVAPESTDYSFIHPPSLPPLLDAPHSPSNR